MENLVIYIHGKGYFEYDDISKCFRAVIKRKANN